MKGKVCLLHSLLGIILTLFLFSISANAQQIQGYIERGGFQYSGSSTARVQRSYPGATVTVYNPGTTNLASIYSNSTLSTPKSNPFTADSNGFYSFYAKSALYDIKFSGTGITTPWTISSISSGTTISGLIDFKSLGAKCDGVTDDSALLISLAGSMSSGIISVSEGTCYIDNNVTIGSNIILSFTGDGILKVGSSRTITLTNFSIADNNKAVFSGLGNYRFGTSTRIGVYTKWFDFTCNDSYDNTNAFYSIRSLLRARDGSILYFNNATGICRYTNNDMFYGIENLEVDFNYNTLRNQTTSPFNAQQTSIRLNNDFYDNSGDVFGGIFTENKNFINDAAMMALSVTLKIPAESSEFDIGDNVFIGGFDQQGGGGPDNLRYFEINKVISINAGAGIITLEKPLKWDYNDDWYSIPAFIISLNRTDKSNIAERIVFRNLYTAENTVPPPGFGAHGKNWSSGVEIQGVKDFEGYNINTNMLGVTMLGTAKFKNCNVFYSDLDKQVDKVYFEDTDYHYLLGGTGINYISFINGKVIEQVQLNSRDLDFNNNTLLSTHISNQSKVYAPDYYGRNWSFNGNVNIPRAGESNYTGMIGVSEVTFTALTAPTTSSVTIAVDFNVIRSFGKGSVCRTIANKQVTVSDIISNGSNITIQGTWNSPPQAADVYKCAPLINLDLNPITNTWEGTVAKLRPLIFSDSAGRLPAENWNEDLNTKIYTLPTDAFTQPSITVDGYVKRITVHIDTAYTGATVNPNIYLDEQYPNPFAFRWFQVNVANKGTRIIATEGSTGAKSGDSLPASLKDADGNSRYVKTLWLFNDVMASTGTAQLPKGYIKIEVDRRR